MRIALLIALLFLAPAFAAAQRVSLSSASGLPGSTVGLNVSYSAGPVGISALQFDVTFPSSLACSSVTGTWVGSQGMTGGVKVLIFTSSLATIPPGTIASLHCTISSTALPGQITVGIGNIVAASPEAIQVPTSGSGGIVTVTAPADLTPPTISAAAVSGLTNSGATISWTTNEASNSQVEYGVSTSYGTSTALNSAMVTSHSQTLTGLTSAKLYHYRLKSRDAAGNLATSGDRTFTTLSPSDTTPPVISAAGASAITASTALITWSTNETSSSQVEYGATAVYGMSTSTNAALITTHSALLSGLTAGSTYHFRVKSADAAGNLAVSADLTFKTAAAQDGTPPVVSGITVAPTATGAVVRWSTNEPADSQVEYGPTSGYGSETALDTAAVTSHSQSLTGLAPATTYHVRVKSRDGDGNLGLSGDLTFKTSEESADKAAPKITNVRVTGIGTESATVSWSLDEPADARVEYGETASYGSQTILNTELVAQHAETITGLKAGTAYHFRVVSRDAAGNGASSDDYTFATTQQRDDTKLTLSYPRMRGRRAGAAHMGESDYVGVAIANLDSQDATLTFTAYDAAGRQVQAPGLTNPVAQVLKAAAQLPVVDDQLFGDAINTNGNSGWIKVESTSAKIAGFFLMFNSEMNVLDGANISGTPTTSFVLPEIEHGGFTRVNIANPNPGPVELSFDLLRSDGTSRASTTRVVNASGALVADLTDLFGDSPAVASDYMRVRAAEGVLPFELLGKEGEYVEGLNGQPTLRGSQTLYSPQYAVGGPWHSTLSVVNLDSTPGTVTFRFIRDDASQIGATKVLPINGYGKIYIDDPGFFQALLVSPTNVVTQGYIEIISSGVRLTGSVVFGDPERKQFSSALPLVSQLQSSVTFSQVSSNDRYFTGIAMLNPGVADVFATVELYGANGNRESMTTVPLRARQRKSILLTELFPALVGQDRTSGYVKVTAEKEIAAFAVFGAHDLSVLSAIPPQ